MKYRIANALSVLQILLLAASGWLAAAGVESRSVNDGNVILEGVPEIPDRIVNRLNRFQNVRSAVLVDWGPEGDEIFIRTRFADVAQVHRVSMPGGARSQLTYYSEPVVGAHRRHHSSSLLLSMDRGGSEFYQFYLLDPKSGEHRLLTDGKSRNGSPVWSGDGELLAFSSTRRTGRHNDVYMMSPSDPDSTRLVLESPDGSFWAASDWSEDNRRLLVVQYVNVRDSRVHLLEVDSGKRRLLAGGEEDPSSHRGVSPRFSADGRGVFFSTDAFGEFEQLAHHDLESGEVRLITGELPWDVEELALSEDRSRAAFVINEGGISRLYLMDPSTFEYRRADSVPLGLISTLRFSPDGTRLAFTLNSPTTPSDVFSLDLGSDRTRASGLARWTFSEVGGLDAGRFVVPELIHYPTFDRVEGVPRQIPAFIFRPEKQGPHPVVVFIHGGPEAQYRPSFNSIFQLWIQEIGAAVIAPNVRGSTGYGKEYVSLDDGYLREDAVRDIGALLDWIETQDDLDPDRVAVFGGSYGGYMVLASLVHFGERLRAGVNIVGISNFVTFLENTESYRRQLRREEYGDERDPEMRDFLERISPSNNAHRIISPLFVAQGHNDPRVPVTESEQIVGAVRENGRSVWYMNALNEGHGFRRKENRDLFERILILFLEEHLGG